MIDRLVTPLLLVGCVFFGIVLIVEIKAPDAVTVPPSSAVVPSDPLPAPHRLPIAPAPPPIAAILARPLFSPSRRPPHSSADAGANDAGLADSRLAGIVIEAGRRFAIFAPEGAKLLRVTEGETVSGWRVESISPREVSLSGPEGTRTLQPKFDPNLAPPPEPEPTPPQPTPGFGPGVRGAAGVVPQPGTPAFMPGQARLRQLRRR